MSFRDIFMTNKKKRPRTPTNDQSESSNSFVKNMKSRVSGLVPARISQWFSSSGSSVAGNGSTQMNDDTDSSEDELELTPPAKRKCLNSQESQYNQQFDVESTSFQADNLSNSHNILYSSIQSPPGRAPFTRDLKHSSTQEESNVESASFDTTDTNVSNKHMPSTSGQSVAMKRNSIFDISKIKESAKKIKSPPPAVTDGLLSDAKPRFRPSLYGSPFYPGPTMYGGASASTYINKPIVNLQRVVKVRESNKTASDTLSVSTRRVLELLEDFPSPLIEAKRIPVLQNWDRSAAQEISSPKSGTHSYKKQELTIPSIASILRLKQHSRLMDTTKAVRQIIASHSSTLPNLQHYYYNSECNTSKASEKERSHKLKTRVTRIDRGMDELTMPVPVQLPTAVLQIDKDNLPKFSMTSTSSTTSLSALPTKSVFDSNYKPQPTSVIKTPPSIFSNTEAAKTPPSWSGNTMFKFANPAASPVHISQEFKIMNKITEMENTNEKEAKEEVVQLNTSTKKSETPKNTATLDNSKGWNCSDCWVNNKSDVDRCVCCSAKRPSSKDKNTQGQDSSTPSIGVCMPATSAFVPFSISGPIAVKQEWTCDNCWIKNKNSVKKCAACGGSKPGGIESMPTLAPNLGAKSEKDWTCETCYVKNKSTVLKCIACSASKAGKDQSPSIGTNLSSFKPPDGKLQEIMRVQKDKWECPGCLIRNESDKSRCQCCDMEREGPSKEITPKPFTFPRESNINFKFGIDPKEQEKNIAKKVEEVPKPGFKFLEQTEANNNTYLKFSSNDAKFNETKFNDALMSDEKGDSVVPEGPKASFTFGIPKKTQEETKPATVPYFDKPKTDNQDKTKLTFGIIEPPKTENSTPIKAFPTFLATSTPMTCAKTQSIDAPTVASLNKNPLTEIKSTNPTFRFGDPTADKPKQFSFEGESGRAGAGVNAVSLSSTNAAPAFSFGASLQNRAASTSTSPSTSLFAGPQVTNATTKPPNVTLFGTTESTSATATAAAPLFTFRNDAPSTTPESKPFSFGSTNNSDIKPTQFGSIASNDIKVSPFGTGNQNENKSSLFALANNDNKVPFGSTNQNENKVSPFASAAQSGSAPFGSVNNIENKVSPFGTVTNNENKVLGFGAPTNTENKVSPFGSASSNENKASPFGGFTAPSGFSISAAPTLGGTVASMASSMSGLNESGSGASSAGFRPSTQEAAWPAKSETSFGATGGAAARDSTQFTFGGIGNQFGSSGAGTGTNVFGAQPSSATQNVFGIASPPAGGGLFGNTTQPAQPTMFGAQQHTSNVFGAQNQASSAFGVPTPTQSPAFGAHTPTQSPAFGSAAQSAASAFGAPAPSSQTPAFGIPTQSQQTAFGAPVQNQSSAFGVPAQNQPSVFGAAASSQPAAFGTPTQPTAATGAGFNFGSGVFSFGQQTTQQTQPLGVYSFGSGNTMGGMMSQPMDGGLGAGGVQFTMGSAPAPATAPSMRRVRKAVRRNQPR